jgi:hypothetical protein
LQWQEVVSVFVEFSLRRFQSQYRNDVAKIYLVKPSILVETGCSHEHEGTMDSWWETWYIWRICGAKIELRQEWRHSVYGVPTMRRSPFYLCAYLSVDEASS